MFPETLSREQIEGRLFGEGQHLDFKRDLKLDTDTDKAKFVDDVVAFLNASGGRLVFGVSEKQTFWEGWRPLEGDRDALARKIQSIVQDNIDPSPTGVSVIAIELDSGFALDVRIPEHRMQPYQNKINGGFRVRTDKQNKIVPRDEIYSYFKKYADYKVDLQNLMQEEKSRLLYREIMADDGPVLEIGILMREHYDNHPSFIARKGYVVSNGPEYGGGANAFNGCEDGHEAKSPRIGGIFNCRIFISDDWFVYAYIVNPFEATNGKVLRTDVKRDLGPYLEFVLRILSDNGIQGPFAFAAEFSRLKDFNEVSWAFPNSSRVTFSPRMLLEKLDASALAEQVYEALSRSSGLR